MNAVEMTVITMLSSSAGIDVAYEPTKATALPEKSVIIELREEMTLAGFMSVERSPSMSKRERSSDIFSPAAPRAGATV